MESLAKNGSTVFVDALMTCCPDEKELLLSWKGIIVLIFCAKVRERVAMHLCVRYRYHRDIESRNRSAGVWAENKFWIS